MTTHVSSQPTNSLVTPLLTDMYQLSMAYAYWRNEKQDDNAVFDLFFRKNPFKGEYTIFAGLDEVLKFVMSFKFTESDIAYLQTILPHALHVYKDVPVSSSGAETTTVKQNFFDWLRQLTAKDVRVYACEHGSVVFPRIPLIRIEGPLAVTQLMETGLLNLVNYPSLVATNAARMRHAVGPDKILLEFGLRRAQGPDGGISASKYAYVGGFNATSNVLAGKLFDIGVKGTHAHAFVMSYSSLSDLHTPFLHNSAGVEVDFLERCLFYRQLLDFGDTNDGELAAFIAYAQSFPHGFLALIDTYDTLNSGVQNFVVVAMALIELGYKPLGIRLDSGDLAYISRQVRALFRRIDQEYRGRFFDGVDQFTGFTIVASNDIDEEILLSLQQTRRSLGGAVTTSASTTASATSPPSSPGVPPPFSSFSSSAQPPVSPDTLSTSPLRPHEIDVFGIGTNLVTCRNDPALGCVYKLVEINGIPRIKVSQEMEKIVIPSRKQVYRLYGKEGCPLVDVMLAETESEPKVGEKLLVKHPFRDNVEAYVKPTKIEALLHLVYDGPGIAEEVAAGGVDIETIYQRLLSPHCNLTVARTRCLQQLSLVREDHVRPVNPTPYKISVSAGVYDGIRALLKKEKKETILS